MLSYDSRGTETVKWSTWGGASLDLGITSYSFLLTGRPSGTNLIEVVEGRSWAVALRAAIVICGG